jgi:hypothetical protein
MLSIIFSYFANNNRDADFIKLATAGVRHILMDVAPLNSMEEHGISMHTAI